MENNIVSEKLSIPIFQDWKKEFIKDLKENSVETHNCDENCKGYEACKINESLVIKKEVLDKLAEKDYTQNNQNGEGEDES